MGAEPTPTLTLAHVQQNGPPVRLGKGLINDSFVSFGPQGPRPDLAAAQQSRQRLAGFITELQAKYAAPAAKTVIAGFSQGGIMSASIGLIQPELVAGFGILSGRILPETEPQLASRTALASIHAFIGHGRHDTKLTVDWAHRADAWLTELGVPHCPAAIPATTKKQAATRCLSLLQP